MYKFIIFTSFLASSVGPNHIYVCMYVCAYIHYIMLSPISVALIYYVINIFITEISDYTFLKNML